VSRLEYRKGADFLVDIIPAMLQKYPKQLQFIIGGGGRKMGVIKSVVEKRELTDKVTLLGPILPNNVRATHIQGDIFLNTSLTESFCIANLEAACSGLLVVSTDVGGVPEVLPPHMTYLAETTIDSILGQLEAAVERVLIEKRLMKKHKEYKRQKYEEKVQNYKHIRDIYNWQDIARRTEKVYDYVMYKQGTVNTLGRMKLLKTWGPIVYIYGLFEYIINLIFLFFLETGKLSSLFECQSADFDCDIDRMRWCEKSLCEEMETEAQDVSMKYKRRHYIDITV